MPSMSYCMFENTEIELANCVEAMEQVSSIEDLDMSSYEELAFRTLWRTCREFLAEHERLLNTVNEGETV